MNYRFINQNTRDLLGRMHEVLNGRGLTIATAESCTGGLLAALLTETAGSSDYFLGGVVAYSNSIKEGLLEVPSAVLTSHGAVSSECALLMARGVGTKFGASIAVSLTGIAGPSGGTPTKPVGTVWLGWSTTAQDGTTPLLLSGDRTDVRFGAALAAIAKIVELSGG